MTVVVDDGSTDRTAEIARRYGSSVTVMQQVHSGPGAATTRGLGAVQTPLWAGLDADDVWLVDKAARQIDRLARNPHVDAVFGWMRLFRHGEVAGSDAPVREHWGRSTMMIRLSAAQRIGPIIDPPKNPCGEMIDWLARARDLNLTLEMMPEVLALRRIIAGSLSQRHGTSGGGYLHVAKAALDRKRSRQS
jgi:glycosyltransferase involved in cell wall biosynthesis